MTAGPATAEVRAELERSLGVGIVRIERRPSLYRTSFALEELDVTTGDGRELSLVLKDVSPAGLSPGARGAKPHFLYDPEREIDVYREVVGPNRLGPVCYAAVAEPERSRYWLVLERVPGVELYQVGDLGVWEDVARWLARMHERCRGARPRRLLRYDADLYRRWLARALDFRPSAELERIADGYGAIVERLAGLPVTFVHGELYASNVLVVAGPAGLRVAPVDWEMASLAPGLLDLAALTSGGLAETQREGIARAYHEALPEGRGPWETLLTDLDRFRLHLAVQWLGWSRDWTPPPEHAHDWLNEALRAAERLGI